MLRRKKFSRVETIILCIFAVSLLAAGFAVLFLAVGRDQWKLALASAGVLSIGALYLLAAKRGKPL